MQIDKFSLRLIYAISLMIMLNCTESTKEEAVIITIEYPSEILSEVKVTFQEMLSLNQKLLARGSLDSSGRCVLEFPTDRERFAVLRVGDRENYLYLKSGYKLHISPDVNGNLMVKGHGAEANNYLLNVMELQSAIMNRGGKNIAELDRDAFSARLDTLEKSLLSFHKQFTDSIPLSDYLLHLLKRRNEMRILSLRQAFQWNYGVTHNFEIPKEYDISDDIPADSILLKSDLLDYALLFQFDLNLKSRSLQKGSKTVEEMPLSIKNEIEERPLPPFMKEFLSAKNVDYWMGLMGIESPVHDLYVDFKNKYPNSSYLNSLENRFNKYFSLSKGHPAPPIIGTTALGDTVSSTHFINKVVYVDIWATWCGPCIQEFPKSKELEKKFESNGNVVFLYVSVDKDRDAWLEMLHKNQDFPGVHILETGEEKTSIWQSYQIAGIPRYIIIDKNGKIESADAPRPSSGKVEDLIYDLLAN